MPSKKPLEAQATSLITASQTEAFQSAGHFGTNILKKMSGAFNEQYISYI